MTSRLPCPQGNACKFITNAGHCNAFYHPSSYVELGINSGCVKIVFLKSGFFPLNKIRSWTRACPALRASAAASSRTRPTCKSFSTLPRFLLASTTTKGATSPTTATISTATSRCPDLSVILSCRCPRWDRPRRSLSHRKSCPSPRPSPRSILMPIPLFARSTTSLKCSRPSSIDRSAATFPRPRRRRRRCHAATTTNTCTTALFAIAATSASSASATSAATASILTSARRAKSVSVRPRRFTTRDTCSSRSAPPCHPGRAGTAGATTSPSSTGSR